MIKSRSAKLLLSVFFICIWAVALNMELALSRTPSDSPLSSCEKDIQLYDLKPEKVVSNEIGYTIHYRLTDKFPSNKAFTVLQNQLVECGWKPYNALEFVINDADWTSYLEDHKGKETAMVHRFGRTYIDQTGKRLASILIIYFSKASSVKETMKLGKPNNNMQFITLQFMSFNEEEYRRKLDEHINKSKSK